MVEGVGVPDLKKGPGHYPETPLPGQEGNAAIAGHRTTYGAPFNRIDELEPGDEILVQTLQGTFRYIVERAADRLALARSRCSRTRATTASPSRPATRSTAPGSASSWWPSSARTRTRSPPGRRARSRSTTSAGAAASCPTILFGLLCAAIWVFAWALGRLWRKWPAYFVALPFFLVALFYFFEEFSRVLPSDY